MLKSMGHTLFSICPGRVIQLIADLIARDPTNPWLSGPSPGQEQHYLSRSELIREREPPKSVGSVGIHLPVITLAEIEYN